MYLVDQAKLESINDSEHSKYLNLGDWLGVEAEQDGRVSVWADVNSSFFGLKRKVREQLGFLPSEIANILNGSIKNGRRVRARLNEMQKHFKNSTKKIPDGAYALKSGGKGAKDVLGHITSSYFSPTLDKPIAMALLKNGKSLKGQVVDIPIENGNRLKATVVEPQFYDIEGKRQNV